MKSLLFYSLTILLFSCGNKETVKKHPTVEIYEYYEDGTVKSIANYTGGKSHKRFLGVRFQELYTFEEVMPLLNEMGILLKIHRGQQPVIAYCSPAEKREIELQINQKMIDSILPGLTFAWSPEPEKIGNESAYLLYALKPAAKNKPQLTNRAIATVEKTKNEQTGQLVLDITLTEEGTKDFAKITSEAIGESLAIAADGIVFSAPLISMAITNGKLQISGNFSAASLTDLEAIISYGILNGELREFHPNGKLKSARNFESGEEKGSWKEYDENGKLVKVHKR